MRSSSSTAAHPQVDKIVGNQKLVSLSKTLHSKGKYMYGACDSPAMLFVRSRILKDHRVTGSERWAESLAEHCKEFSRESVIVDDNLITCSGSGDGIQFGLCLISHVVNEETARAVAEQLSYQQYLARPQ